jgi:hypothetical protein
MPSTPPKDYIKVDLDNDAPIPTNQTTDSQNEPNVKSSQQSAKATATTDRATKKSKKGQKAKEEWGLPTLRVVDQDGKVITVNPEKPTPIESEYFKGVILIMLKCDGEFSEYNRYADHFGKKQRKFEVQFQVSFSPFLLSLSWFS